MVHVNRGYCGRARIRDNNSLPALISINAPATIYRELFEKSLIDTREKEKERERETASCGDFD